MTGLVSFECLVSHLGNFMAQAAVVAFLLAGFNGGGGGWFLTLSRSHDFGGNSCFCCICFVALISAFYWHPKAVSGFPLLPLSIILFYIF